MMYRIKIRELSTIAVLVGVVTAASWASNHREAPITALDHKADITDVWAFVSYTGNQQPNMPPEKVAIILSVDPLLEPANGPNWFPFDPNILYEIHVDNNHDAQADVTFQFRFSTEIRLPGVYTAFAGFGDAGAKDPETGGTVIPPRVNDFNDAGFGLRQTYTVTMKKGNQLTPIANQNGSPLYVVPANVGPQTMDYEALFNAGTYSNLSASGVSLWSGTSDDAFFIDLGGAFDSGNLRVFAGGTGVPGVLSDAQDAANINLAADTVSGYAVNSICIEVPIEMLTSDGQRHAATDPKATIGIWCTTSRPRILVRRFPHADRHEGPHRQIQRFGNPLINELVIGTGSKDKFSQSEPKDDAQFADFFLGMTIAQVIEALYNELFPGALDVPDVDRTDLLLLVQYRPPIAASGTPTGPIADLMRLNTGVPATPPASASRLGVLGGDLAGYPNGRRLADDVVDITLRAAVGGVLVDGFNKFPNNRLGDGVNVNDVPFRNSFPYLGSCPSGRDRRHIDPGEQIPGGGIAP
jgi:hypothetical protein